MFSGIVETLGEIIHVEWLQDCMQLQVKPLQHWDDLQIGDSVSINGVCLTVTAFSLNSFSVTVVPETLRLTNLSELNQASLVNLERSLKVDGRIGGHNVQGHVDAIGKILELTRDGKNALLVKISCPAQLSKYIVDKGYITLDGMSITVIKATAHWFTVTFIPHTQAITIVKNYIVNQKINIEVDILGKYVEKLLGAVRYASTH
ncbi:MAG: riboflavin synthase [Gammaproteobacteria bacterium]|nr:riboflavin synthase [Gammaproteobacteria bacterium]